MEPFVIHANLDAEATWGGVALPTKIRERISLYAALLAALAPPENTAPVEVWALAPVDPTRLVSTAGWTPPAMRVGKPPSAQLAWANQDARAVNDRAFALSIATGEGAALPGARVIDSA